MKILDVIVTILLIVGGLNWGLVGVANFNLVTHFVESHALVNIIYILVGLSAVYKVFQWRAMCRRWSCSK